MFVVFLVIGSNTYSFLSIDELTESSACIRAGWSRVQKEAEHAVIQVFSQTAEPNILKPYRIENGESRGTAFLITESGEILTNYHVVAGAVRVVVQMPLLFGKKTIEVEVKSVCPERDIALLKLHPDDCQAVRAAHGSMPYLHLGNSDCVERSDELLSLGFPLGQESLKSVTGVVSGEEHVSISSGGRTIEERCIQVSTPMNPGNSGGPVLNKKGEVVGINTAGIGSAQSVGYVIPISEYELVRKDLSSKPLVKKPFIGASACYAEGDEIALFLGNPIPSGCYLTKVHEYGLAHELGLRSGDMVHEINGLTVDVYGHVKVPIKDDRMSVSDYISSLPLGHELVLIMYRCGKRNVLKGIVYCPHEPPVRWKYFPYDKLEYEIIGGMLFQDLSLNIISFFNDPQIVQQIPEARDYLSRYLSDESEREQSAVIVTQILSSSFAHRTRAVGLGEIITEVNGKPVQSLQDVRAALDPVKLSEFITFKTRDEALLVFNARGVMKDELRLSESFNYTITPHTRLLLEAYKIV